MRPDEEKRIRALDNSFAPLSQYGSGGTIASDRRMLLIEIDALRSQVEQLTKERDAAERLHQKVFARSEERGRWLDEAEAEARRLREALNQYGVHKTDCLQFLWASPAACHCGFEQALTPPAEKDSATKLEPGYFQESE